MKIETDSNALYDIWIVKPWDDPIAADVWVSRQKIDPETGQKTDNVRITIGTWKTDAANARLWAEAILKACEIAEQVA